jgi:hypothetical protein
VSALVPVPFHGDELLAHQDERGVWVVVKRVCESLGIDSEGQRQRLIKKPWAVACVIKATGPDGKTYSTMALHLDALPMWLATIDAARVAPAVRAKIERYQVEAARVLRDHFFGKPTPALSSDPPPWAREILTRLEALEGGKGAEDFDGQIGPSRSALIRRELLTYGALMGHGDPRQTKSWRTSGDNELRATLKYGGSGRSWARLPVARYGEALSVLEAMLKRARKIDVDHLTAAQLPLKAG